MLNGFVMRPRKTVGVGCYCVIALSVYDSATGIPPAAWRIEPIFVTDSSSLNVKLAAATRLKVLVPVSAHVSLTLRDSHLKPPPARMRLRTARREASASATRMRGSEVTAEGSCSESTRRERALSAKRTGYIMDVDYMIYQAYVPSARWTTNRLRRKRSRSGRREIY